MSIKTKLSLLLTALLTLSVSAVCAQAPVSDPGPQLSVEQRVARLERMLESQGLMDMLQQLQQLQRDINMLRGEIETQNYNLEQLTRRQRDLYTDIDQRMQRLESGGSRQAGETGEVPSFTLGETQADDPPLETLTTAPRYSDQPAAAPSSGSGLQIEIVGSQQATSPGQTQPSPGNTAQTARPAVVDEGEPEEAPADSGTLPAASPPAGPADPVQLQAEYQQAFNLLRQSRYDQAIRAFQEFLARHAGDRYSDNAQYWLAEAYYVKREFEQALVEYRKVIDNYPQSQKVNDALLKIGFTQYELGNLEAARSSLQELVDNQPGTTVARLADERLKLINSTAPNTPPASN